MLAHKNILVIQTAFIGDAILASSVLEKLHAFYPKASISILVRKGNESLYEAHPFIKQCLVWNKKEGKYKSLIQLLKFIRKQKFDTIINLHRYASSGFLTAFSRANYTSGFNKNPFSFLFNHKASHKIGDGRHEIQRYNDLIETITDASVAMPKLYPTYNHFKKIEILLSSKFICIAPSSVWFTKQLPKHKWIELCNSVGDETTIYILGSQQDIALGNEIKELSKHNYIQNLAGTLSLLESCELMKHAKMNYVNDSAPLHLASSVNAATTVFFCSTIPEFGFGPLAKNSKTIQVNNLDCRPCGIHGHKKCPKDNFRCGNYIELPIT